MPEPQAKPVTITVAAAMSLKGVMEELQDIYQDAHPHVTVTLNLGSSGSLQQQIEQGAPIDLFFSAAQKQMNELQKQGLIIDSTRLNLLENKMVLIAPADSSGIEDFHSLLQDSVKNIGIGEIESTPVGKYAQEILTSQNLWDALKPKYVFAKDARQLLTWVETKNVEAALAFATDALPSGSVRIIADAPEGSHTPAVYPAAVVAASKETEAAKEFLAFTATEAATKVYAKYGFTFVAEK